MGVRLFLGRADPTTWSVRIKLTEQIGQRVSNGPRNVSSRHETDRFEFGPMYLTKRRKTTRTNNRINKRKILTRSFVFVLTRNDRLIKGTISSWSTCYRPVIFNHCFHLKLGHRFHALLKVCSDRDDVVPLSRKVKNNCINVIYNVMLKIVIK